LKRKLRKHLWNEREFDKLEARALELMLLMLFQFLTIVVNINNFYLITEFWVIFLCDHCIYKMIYVLFCVICIIMFFFAVPVDHHYHHDHHNQLLLHSFCRSFSLCSCVMMPSLRKFSLWIRYYATDDACLCLLYLNFVSFNFRDEEVFSFLEQVLRMWVLCNRKPK
jgi:hypothetical protein